MTIEGFILILMILFIIGILLLTTDYQVYIDRGFERIQNISLPNITIPKIVWD